MIAITDTRHYSDIADAIRERAGTEATYLPSEMAGAIAAIPAGGADPWPVRDDGRLHAWLDLPEGGATSVTMALSPGPGAAGTVDWGDGTGAEALAPAMSHDYAAAGTYEVVVEAASGTTTLVGDGSLGPFVQPPNALVAVDVPGSGFALGSFSLFRAYRLASAVVHEGVASLGTNPFYGCTSLASVAIPASVASIGSFAFRECSSLASVKIPEGVTSLSENAFHDCKSLVSVSMPEGMKTIGSSAFHGCTSLASVAIPEGVTRVRNSTFRDCYSLASASLHERVSAIESYAFQSCRSLVKLRVLAETPPTLGENALAYTHSSLVVRVPAASLDAYKAASGWSSYADKMVGV